jgi:hypothetical protein
MKETLIHSGGENSDHLKKLFPMLRMKPPEKLIIKILMSYAI